MTKNARIVLQDAKFAIAAHTDTLQSEHFRISWISVVALLRAVGHVLEKVDAEESSELRAAIEKKWHELNKIKPEPKIFWGFIDYERNRFLKNYTHGIKRILSVPGLVINSVPTTIVFDAGNSRGGEFSPGSKLQSTISDGPFAGYSERAVAWEAYDWWVEYLDEIDRIASGLKIKNLD